MNEAVIDSTTRLIREAQSGDGTARDRLFARCRPLLRRWARGRLPHFARDLADTEDLVQTALTRAFTNLDRFEARGTGSFLAYLRTITLNAVKEELRRSGRRPEDTERFEAADDSTNPVLEDAISADTLADYESGLDRLDEPRREAVVLRLEFGLSYSEIAEELGLASADAARMKVSRALVRLAEVMRPPDDSAGAH
ncbi:MAG: sigma-70 family RNA polymerase sigma factor [Gammaproteobacteria bacterium]|jgi:RNA polymerase sigma-70 factor (ECF subfamily)|nr:sigma-70 family RNA polymerase sigma factor [Gammaproteobacteria bacterium]